MQEREESPDLQEPTLRSADGEKGRRFLSFLHQDFTVLSTEKERFPFFLSHFR